MSITIARGGRVRTVRTALASTATTAVYTAEPSVRPIVLGIAIANITSATVTAIVESHDEAASAQVQLTGTHSIAGHDRLEISDIPLALLDGDEIRVTAGASASLHVHVSALEGAGR